MAPADVSEAVLDAVRRAVEAGELDVAVPDSVVIERPRDRAHGDYATNVALRLAKSANRPPREVAVTIAARLREHPGIAAVDVAGPGFINITLAHDALARLAGAIVEAGTAYGQTAVLAGQRINFEYVSANPVGPVHIGAVRWASVGDAIARLLKASGADVTREYYFNDAGAQIDRFAGSLDAAARGEPTPEGGYSGDHVTEIAATVVEQNPGLLDEPRDKTIDVFRRDGVAIMFDRIKQSLADLGVTFDIYFNERDLYASGEVEAAIRRLREGGHVYDADGASWLRSTAFGDDKDRVIVRSDGRPTYLAPDVAYYMDKRERGADLVLMLLGADHHGYVGRMRAVVAALGDDPDEHFEVLIGQMITLHGGRMSKRAGNVVNLEDLVEAIGVDATRYALVRSSLDSTIDLDLDLWARRTSDNPVFYVQYAHARLASLLRNARELRIDTGDSYDVGLLTADRERELLGTLGEFPRIVSTAAELREPHRIARYLEDLAGAYHRFYDTCRVLPQGDDEVTPLTIARLWLCDATRIVLANGLDLLGLTAPERM